MKSIISYCRYCHVAGIICFLLGGQVVFAASRVEELPPVAGLVEKYAAVVVNVSATSIGSNTKNPLLQDDDTEISQPDWLRHFSPKKPIVPKDREEQVFGSGFIISADGYVLTNAHVVESATDIMVRLSDKREFTARVVGTDKRTDIALLKLDSKTALPKAVLGDPAKLRVGEWVVAIGSPFGFDSSVTAGIVSAKGRALPDETLVPFIQTDVAINPGNSGGPLFNLKGEVIGINSQIYSRSGGFMGISFAIPINVAMDIQTQLRQSGRVMRGRIGVTIQDVTKDVADSFGLSQASGALVGGLELGSPADKAGVKVGDVILRFDGKTVANSIDLPRIVGATRPGSIATLQLWRSGVVRDVRIAVAEIPDDAKSSTTLPVRRDVRGGNRLGLIVQDLTRDQKKQMQLMQGVAIQDAGGVASRAELRSGDVITAVTAHGLTINIVSGEQFNRMTNTLERGTAVTLLVRRGDTQSFVGLRVPATR